MTFAESNRVQVPAIAVFDFDHTVCRFDSSARFFYWLIRRSAWRFALCLLLLPVVVPFFCFRSTQKLPVRIAIRVATLGQPMTSLPSLIQTFLAQLQPDWAYAEALDRLRWHQQRGDQVVIVTGSLEALVSELLDRAGFIQVKVIGSLMRESPWGWVSARHCIGKTKISELREQGISAPWQYAYSDHFADLPLLKHAEAAFLVNPKAKSLRIVRAKLSAGLQVLHWQ